MAKKAAAKKSTDEKATPKCGIVMPIGALSDYSKQHWTDVYAIHCDAISTAGFEPRMVSDSDDVGVIHKRIIQNLYENEMIVCDVSGKNANVMFELGLRLAFDKPTIVVIDDATSYSFDTSPIEHLSYRRDLRYAETCQFKETLGDKVAATFAAASGDPSYTTFLGHFGPLTAVTLETEEVSGAEYVLSELREIRRLVSSRETKKDFSALSTLPDFVVEMVVSVGKETAAKMRLVYGSDMIEKMDEWTRLTTEKLGEHSIHVSIQKVKPILVSIAEAAPPF